MFTVAFWQQQQLPKNTRKRMSKWPLFLSDDFPGHLSLLPKNKWVFLQLKVDSLHLDNWTVTCREERPLMCPLWILFLFSVDCLSSALSFLNDPPISLCRWRLSCPKVDPNEADFTRLKNGAVFPDGSQLYGSRLGRISHLRMSQESGRSQ